MRVWAPQKVFQQQPDAVLNQANPVANTLYPVLETENALIIAISAFVNWTVQPTPLEIVITVDGQTITHSQVDPVNGTPYYPVRHGAQPDANQIMDPNGAVQMYQQPMYEGRSVKIEARTGRTTPGTVSLLATRVKWRKL